MAVKIDTLEDFLALVERATGHPPLKVGGGYKCLCPAHSDQNPSLSVRQGKTQPFILKCHAGCTYDQIINALGYGNGAYPPAGAAPSANGRGKVVKKPKAKEYQLGKVVATYPYHNPAGVVLYEKLRYEPKNFRVKNPNGWGIGEHEPVLYRLPELVNAPEGSLIFVCEGEKDVDNLVNLGLLATCNFDGASKPGSQSKWRDSYNSFFTGHDVIVLPDNDAPGRAHATDVAKALTKLAKRVRVLELPELPDKGDVSDWLSIEGNDAEKLLELVGKTPSFEKSRSDFNLLNPKTDDYRKALRSLDYTIRLNLLDDTLEVNGSMLNDVTEAHIRSRMYDLGFKGAQRMSDALVVEAAANKYHPVKEYLEGLEWDGKDHIGLLTSHYIKDSTMFLDAALKRWLIGAVAKVYEQARTFMLVLDGSQNVGKSTFARWLCPLPDLFIEAQINPDDTDCMLRLCRSFVWEIPEVDATTKKSDVSALKDFITKKWITARKSYGKHDIHKPALAALIGTINGDGAGFLRDSTGNTRFVTVRLESVDFDYTKKIDINQIWAQAYTLYKAGERWELSPEEQIWRDDINSEYETESYLEVLFYECFEVRPDRKDQWITAAKILDALEVKGLKGNQQSNLRELKAVLTRAGAHRFRPHVDGSRQWAYAGVVEKIAEIEGGL